MKENGNEWEENLNLICMGYNTSIHEATGYTPFELRFGRKANIPSKISTPSMTYEELFNVGKNVTRNIYRNSPKHSKKIKFGINDSKMCESSKQYSILETKYYSITNTRKTNWTQNGLDQQK
mgnify:CR=1 FL=1